MRKFAFLMVLLPLCLIGYVFSLCKVLTCNHDDAMIFLAMSIVIVLFGYLLSSLVVKVCKATIEDNKKKDEEVRKELACDIFIGNALKVFWVIGYILLAFCALYADGGDLIEYHAGWLFLLLVASLGVFYAIYKDWDLRLFSIYLYDAEEQLNKGESYLKRGNYSKALKCFRIAAELGNQYAQYYLGTCYYHGVGVVQDYEKAVKWYTKSAEQGHADAQCHLGFCYAKGYGVFKDLKEAVEWFTKAAKQGNEEAKEALESLRTQ